MTTLRKIWRVTWQAGLCLLLLTWIFHSIFTGEGRQAWVQEAWSRLSPAQQETILQREGQQAWGKSAWDAISRQERWRQAWTVGPSELGRTLRMARPAALWLSVFLAWLMVVLGVVRWRMVLEVQGLRLSLPRATAITFISQFFSSFMLGSTGGDLIKAYYAARETHHKKTEAVVTVFVDRLIGLWAMLLFAGLMMLPNLGLMLKYVKIRSFGALIFGMLLGSTVVLYLAFWGGVSKRFPRARVWLRRLPKGEIFEKSIDSCRQFGKHRAFLFKATLMSLVINTVVVLQVTVLAAGLGLNISTVALFLIVPVVVCISALPIAPGGGMGLREYLYIFLLGCLMVPKTSALSLSLLAYAPTLFWNLLGGLVYLGLKDKEHLAEVTHATAAVE
jgi:uncharacterized protein (TIRG00374 family)